jgi:hypothetical protein
MGTGQKMALRSLTLLATRNLEWKMSGSTAELAGKRSF